MREYSITAFRIDVHGSEAPTRSAILHKNVRKYGTIPKLVAEALVLASALVRKPAGTVTMPLWQPPGIARRARR